MNMEHITAWLSFNCDFKRLSIIVLLLRWMKCDCVGFLKCGFVFCGFTGLRSLDLSNVTSHLKKWSKILRSAKVVEYFFSRNSLNIDSAVLFRRVKGKANRQKFDFAGKLWELKKEQTFWIKGERYVLIRCWGSAIKLLNHFDVYTEGNNFF